MLINKQNFHNLKFQFPFTEHAVNKNSKRSEMYLLVSVIVGVLKQGGTECIKLKRKKKSKSWWFWVSEEDNRTKTCEEFLCKPQEEEERNLKNYF